MPTRYDDTDDDLRSPSSGGDREISLGTGTILGIFLALALVCSLFFGLGYSMGRKVSPTLAAATPVIPRSAGDEDRAFPQKPSGSQTESLRSDSQVAQPSSPVADPDSSIVLPVDHPTKSAVRETAKPAPTTLEISTPTTPGFAPTYVQVAAVSRKEDADLLMSALKRRGYTGIIRPQPQDKLLHIQVGPFPTKKDAEAMRQRLITDGYNPILK